MSSQPDDANIRFVLDDRTYSAEELTPVLYDDLRRMAGRVFRGGGAHQTLQPTALVNEAYLKLVGQRANWHSRPHFLALAARCMRQVMIDAARARAAGNRPDDGRRVTLHGSSHGDESSGTDLSVDPLDLEQALGRLGEVKPRYVELVELRYFGGLTLEEVAEALGVSRTIVVRELAKARSWLLKFLGDDVS